MNESDTIKIKLQAIELAIKAAEHGSLNMEKYYYWIMKELYK